jgi:hypothetical protein
MLGVQQSRRFLDRLAKEDAAILASSGNSLWQLIRFQEMPRF